MKILFLLFFVVLNTSFAALSDKSETTGTVVGFDAKTVTLKNRFGTMKVLKSVLDKEDLAKIKSGAVVTLVIPTPPLK